MRDVDLGSHKVKSLNWKGPDCFGMYHSRGSLWDYFIRSENGNGIWLSVVGNYFATIEDAKSAAQADYENKIFSAIEKR